MKPLYLLTLLHALAGTTRAHAQQAPAKDTVAVNNKVQGMVMVQFIVNKDSTISHVLAIVGPDKGGLREEAIRVITLSGRWIPAKQNGNAVRSYKKQPVIFKLQKG
jgi:hypothetical protein